MTDNKNNKSKDVFISSIIRTGTKTQKITNTPQNMYINQVTKSKSPSKSNFKNIYNNYEKTESESETDSDIDTNSIISSDEQNKYIINRKNINITNLTGEDKDKDEDKEEDKEDDNEENNKHIEDNENNIESEEEIDDDDIESEKNIEDQNEDETEDNKDKIRNTEYNEESISEKNNNLDNNCIYQYVDLVEDTNIDNTPREVPRQERMTDPQMTHYEKIRILGIRAKQISMGSKVMVKYNNSISPVELAKFEILHKTSPLLIKRTLPDGSYEIWKMSDFEDDLPIIQILDKSYNDCKLNNKHNLYIIDTS